ncbi:uracil-DNA glycosylase family protein [Parasediminibacterium sp. JCM 36343]|uniref:uracil-DNA glycosylase family protein n=1 Tax=Parasediminibacterium sp. JCM 36343 TaxID=3374279 RepID=UPI00397B919A
MKNYKIKINVDKKEYYSLADILPDNGNLDILFIAKTPATISVGVGHYFQGKQGTMFWNRLSDYGILKVPNNDFADNYLLENNYGITDIVKVPRDYGNEPTSEEYRQGLQRILLIIEKFNPKVIIFVYKAVLDKIIKLNFNVNTKSNYGFNPQLEKYFNSRVFAFPMPGTPCKSEEAIKSMTMLKQVLQK